jgi:hypothetical protein
MPRSDILTSLITAVAVTVVIAAASVLTAAAVTLLMSWSQAPGIVVVMAGVAIAVGIIAVAQVDN